MKLYIHLGGRVIHYNIKDYNAYSVNKGNAKNGLRKSLIYEEMQHRRKRRQSNRLHQTCIKSEKTNPI